MTDNTESVLSAPLWPHGDTALMHLIRRAGQRCTTSWTSTVTTGLSAVQYAILVVLAEMKTCDQQTLGSRAGFDKATGTYLIDKMSKSGLVKTHFDPADRRRKLVSLTAAGRKALNQMIDEAREAEAMVTSGLEPGDIAELKRLLSKMTGLQ
ncbi:MarR family winged helix-turn-helix transcriptional regulator [Rhodococcus sp. T2V]|uniref:MarR family winged helix-turn-helix transcriptional regulator n=1 Tax=Rhodococcus sp. T2V TaxID=3034164 RepID=UPI0023E24D91|nr:MarR family winged helix-turn-helix transcriptional regulator [Rhodococcus sp. T2V]MDF3308384.1 MarR family winged helix-turn-helix transcriptional regulator [Rhodococcus sp. T2V]